MKLRGGPGARGSGGRARARGSTQLVGPATQSSERLAGCCGAPRAASRAPEVPRSIKSPGWRVRAASGAKPRAPRLRAQDDHRGSAQVTLRAESRRRNTSSEEILLRSTLAAPSLLKEALATGGSLENRLRASLAFLGCSC